MLTWGRHYWPVFLVISSVWIATGFGVPELWALFSRDQAGHRDNTLSNYARTELHVSSVMTVHTVAWYLSLLVWLTVTIILTFHIWFDFHLGK